MSDITTRPFLFSPFPQFLHGGIPKLHCTVLHDFATLNDVSQQNGWLQLNRVTTTIGWNVLVGLTCVDFGCLHLPLISTGTKNS